MENKALGTTGGGRIGAEGKGLPSTSAMAQMAQKSESQSIAVVVNGRQSVAERFREIKSWMLESPV